MANGFDFFDDFVEAISDPVAAFEDTTFDFGEFFTDNLGQIARVGLGAAQQFLVPNQGLPAVSQTQRGIPVMAQAPAIGGALIRAGGALMRRFPSLGQAIQALKSKGIPVSANYLYQKLREFGPATLATALASYIGSQLATNAVNELAIRGRKYRRINPCNAKAARRALRRLKSFQRLKMDVMGCAPRTKKRRC